jgi:hypothetical protein
MIPEDVERRVAKALEEGKAYLLVCVDTFDRLRGDSDLGYYYPAFDDAAAVKVYAQRFATGVWDPSTLQDFCEAIIELQPPRSATIHDPSQWLKQQTEK